MSTFAKRVLQSLRARTTAYLSRRRRRVPEMVGRADEFELKRTFQMAFLKSQGMTPQMSVVDLGCGVLRGGLPLIEYLDRGRYCGIDVRRECIRVAKQEVQRAALHAKEPTLIHAETLGTLSLTERFDVIWAFSVLFHMPDDVLDSAFSFAAKHLAKAGTFYANVNIGANNDGRWLEFPVRWRTYEQYEAAARLHGLRTESLGTLETLGHVSRNEPSENLQYMLAFRLAD